MRSGRRWWLGDITDSCQRDGRCHCPVAFQVSLDNSRSVGCDAKLCASVSVTCSFIVSKPHSNTKTVSILYVALFVFCFCALSANSSVT